MPNVFKCQRCVAEGRQSTVTKAGHIDPSIDAGSFYDVDGRQHIHNAEALKTMYVCSWGHVITRTIGTQCWCGWSADRKT